MRPYTRNARPVPVSSFALRAGPPGGILLAAGLATAVRPTTIG
jgi:hypothetical protein